MASYITEFPSNNTSLIENDDSEFNRYADSSFASHLCDELTDSSDGESSVISTRKTPAWNKSGFQEESTEFRGEVPDYSSSCKKPIDYFHMFLNKKMIKQIMEATNLYASQKNPEKVLNVSYIEMEQYIGVLLHMGFTSMPDYRMYWRQETRYPTIADVFTRSRFDQIKANFHLCDNTTRSADTEDYDRLFKVRMLYDHVQSNCKKLDVPEFLSIGLLLFYFPVLLFVLISLF